MEMTLKYAKDVSKSLGSKGRLESVSNMKGERSIEFEIYAALFPLQLRKMECLLINPNKAGLFESSFF